MWAQTKNCFKNRDNSNKKQQNKSKKDKQRSSKGLLDYGVEMSLSTKLKMFLEVSRKQASNGPIVDSRDLNLVSGHTEATHNKLYLSSPTKYTAEPSWSLVLVWLPFELLHRSLTTIGFTQYCRM
ncbi:hypothetical protein TNCV_1912541 [Trichonephila clavipes]|nr:hypothetical protein TNCV_1912541 [Trichonephila clavipes]